MSTTTTIIISSLALILSLLSLLISAANFYMSGPAVRVSRLDVISPQFPGNRHVIEIKASATGRFGVTVESIHFGAAHKATQPFRKDAILNGPQLPHRIEGSSSGRWHIEGAAAMRVYNNLYPDNTWQWGDYYIAVHLGNGKVVRKDWNKSIWYANNKYFSGLDLDQPPWG